MIKIIRLDSTIKVQPIELYCRWMNLYVQRRFAGRLLRRCLHFTLQWSPFSSPPAPMNSRFNSWPEHPQPVIAVMLAVAICAVPVVLPHANLANLMPNLFAYVFACVLAYPVAAVLRHRLTSLPVLWGVAAL